MTESVSGVRRRPLLDDGNAAAPGAGPRGNAHSPAPPWVANEAFGTTSYPAELFSGMRLDPSWTGPTPKGAAPVRAPQAAAAGTASAPPRCARLVATVGNAQVFADRGIGLAAALKDGAFGDAGQLERFIDEYVAYTARKPGLKQLHADAVSAGPEILVKRLDADDADVRQRAEQVLREQMIADRIAPMQVRPPLTIQQRAAVGEVAIPVARAVVTVSKFVPVAGELVVLAEVATGRSLAGLGEKLGDSERAIDAALLAAPFALAALRAGARGSAELIRLARTTGHSIDETRAFCRLAVDVSANRKVIREALEAARVGRALSTDERAALELVGRGAETAPGAAVRRRLYYTPEVEAKPALRPGEGATDKYGNIVYSPNGTAEDVALAKAHESVHSYLSPKALDGLYEFRADLGMDAYENWALCRYLEEALAESYAQVTVNGWSSLPKALAFPIKHGYVTVDELTKEAIGTIVVGGALYGVYVQIERAK